MADLETLTLRITEESSKAFSAIDKLAKRLDGLSASVARLETGKLNDLARGLINLNSAIILIKGATSQADYTRISKELNTLGNVNVNGLNNLAASLGVLHNAFQNIPTTVGVTSGVKELVNSVGKLGGVAIQRAITNIPQLENSLSHLITTFSQLPTVNQSIIDFINSLGNLASQGQRVGTASNTVSNALDRFSSSATRATRRSHSLASTIGTLYAKFWLLMRGARGLKNAFMDAADYLEAYNYFDVTAKKIGKDTFKTAGVLSAEDYADAFTTTMREKLKKMSGLELDIEDRLIKSTNAKSLGLNITEITQYQAAIASLTNSMGLTQMSATATSKALSMLAGDMASLRNLDFSEAASKLQSGITGMARSLYAFGIDITNATLEQYAYANGIEKSVSEMSQAEKAQLRLLAILDQSRVAWGDLANTINSPSNQLRMLKTNLKEVGTVMGQLFIPIMQSVLPVLNGVSIAIKQLMIDIAGLLGIKLDLDSFGTFGDEIDADVDSVEELNSAMEETKKGIRAFDELNVINNSKDKGSGFGNEIDLTKQILEATAEYEKVWDEAYERMTSKAQEIAGYISNAFKPIKEIIKDFHIGDFFKAGTDVSSLVASIFNYVAKAIASVDWRALGKKIGDFIKGIKWGEILKGLGNIIGSALQGALNLWKGMFSVAPFETALLSAFAILKFTGFGDIIKTGLSKALSKQLTTQGLSKEFATALGKLGLISVGIGIAITIDNVKSIKKGEYNAFSLKSLLQSAVSSLFTGAGIALLAKSIGFASGGLAFAIGAAVSLLINILVAAASMDTPYEAAKKVYEAEYQWVQDNNLDNVEILTNVKLKRGEVDTQFMQIDDLTQKVYELSVNYDKLTDGEKGLLKYYSDELIKVMPELANQIDTVTGAYKGTREELDKLIESQKKQIRVDAYKANMSSLMSGITSAEYDEKKLAADMSDVISEENELRKKAAQYLGDDYSDEVWKMAIAMMKGEEKFGYLPNMEDLHDVTVRNTAARLIDEVEGLADAFTDLSAKKDTINESMSTTHETLGKLEAEYNYYAKELGDILGKDIPDTIKEGYDKASTELKSNKLPHAMEDTITKVDQKIKNGEPVTKTDMASLRRGINDSFEGLGDGKVPAEVGTVMDNIDKKITAGETVTASDMTHLYNTINNSFKGLSKGNLPKAVSDTLDKVNTKIENKETVTEEEMKTLFTTINTAFATLKNGAIPQDIQDTMDKIMYALQTNAPGLISYMAALKIQMEKAFADAHYDKAGNIISFSGADGAVTKLDNVLTNIEKTIANNASPKNFAKPFEKAVTEIFGSLDQIPEGTRKAMETAKNALGTSGWTEALSAFSTQLYKDGQAMGLNLVLGMSGSIYDGKDILDRATRTAIKGGTVDPAKDELQEKSPSRVFRQIGKYIPEGAALGIEDGMPKLEYAVTDMTNDIKSAFGDYKYNIPSIDFGTSKASSYNYNTMDANNAFANQLMSMAKNALDAGQTEVVFRVEGDPHGLFKVVMDENSKYRKRTSRSAF